MCVKMKRTHPQSRHPHHARICLTEKFSKITVLGNLSSECTHAYFTLSVACACGCVCFCACLRACGACLCACARLHQHWQVWFVAFQCPNHGKIFVLWQEQAGGGLSKCTCMLCCLSTARRSFSQCLLVSLCLFQVQTRACDHSLSLCLMHIHTFVHTLVCWNLHTNTPTLHYTRNHTQ